MYVAMCRMEDGEEWPEVRLFSRNIDGAARYLLGLIFGEDAEPDSKNLEDDEWSHVYETLVQYKEYRCYTGGDYMVCVILNLEPVDR